jgi:hypothetical protein
VPNLERARQRVLTTLTDTCSITNDPGGHYDDVFNETTGQLDPTGQIVTVYSGVCSVRSMQVSPRVPLHEEIGGQVLANLMYRITLPAEGTEGVTPGQTVTVTACSDSSLVGRTFIVQRVAEGAWEPSRRLDTEDRIDATRQR